MKTFLIIGAGVTGLSSAYHLLKRKAGHVIILEKDSIGGGSSSRAAGITTGLLWTDTGVQARKIALDLFEEWSTCLPGYHYHNSEGCLILIGSEAWPAREKLLPLYDERHLAYDILDPSEIRRRWPDLNPRAELMGLWDPRGGFSEPPQYIDALRQEVVRMGAEIRENTLVRSMLLSGNTVTGVTTNHGDVQADAVICATYAWTNNLLESLGISLPAKSFIHQRYVTKALPSPIRTPAVNADDYFGYIRPTADGKILMGVETPNTPDLPINNSQFQLSELPDQWDLAEQGKAIIEDLLPALKDTTWESAKTGLINFSMDGEPIIGPAPGYEGLYVGLSFHSGGFSYSPVSGLLLAELASTGTTSIDISSFAPDRYSNPAESSSYLRDRVPQSHAVRRRH